MARWDAVQLKPSHDPDWADPGELGREIEADSVVPLAAAHPAQDLRAFRNPRMLYFLAAMIPAQLVFFQLTSSLPLFLVRNLRLPESLYGTVFTLNTLMIVALEVPLNTAMAHWSHRALLHLALFSTQSASVPSHSPRIQPRFSPPSLSGHSAK
jgi:hypothetical protein